MFVRCHELVSSLTAELSSLSTSQSNLFHGDYHCNEDQIVLGHVGLSVEVYFLF
jgi:hypothetical protein